jgi:hypothetical protein
MSNTAVEQQDAFDTCVSKLRGILSQVIVCIDRTPEIDALIEASVRDTSISEVELELFENIASGLSDILPRAGLAAAYGLDDAALDRALRSALSAAIASDEETVDQLTDQAGDAAKKRLSLVVKVSSAAMTARRDDRTSVGGKKDDSEARTIGDD